MDNRMHYRSLFWPVVLIGVGAFWLLSNLGYVTPTNVWEMWRLWPLMLIAGGLDLLFGRRLPIAGAIIGVLVVGVVGAFLLTDIHLPGEARAQVLTERYHLPIDQAKLGRVSLKFWSDPVEIYALKDSQELIDAQVTHVGQINFSGTGQEEKTVRLSHQNQFNEGMFWLDPPNRQTAVGLTPNVPLDLSIDTASGSSDMDLTGLQLTRLTISSGSGSISMTLPEAAVTYPVSLSSRSGSLSLTVPEAANANMEIDSGSGSIHMSVRGNPALRVEIREDGSGSVSLPSGLVQTEQGKGDRGTWETPGFENAKNKIVVTVTNMGSGSLSISD